MYKNKTVSVIIPVYNCDKYIGRTIESVINQSYKDLNIVIIDDCSSDNSLKIINDYVKKYPQKIKVEQMKDNCGVAVARNKGLELSTGRYVAFLDSDDLWVDQKLEKQIVLLKNRNVGFCFTAIEMINEEGLVIKKHRKIKDIVDYKFLLSNTMIPTSSVLIDRNIIGDFKMPLIRSGQDYATWLMILKGGVKAYGINEPLIKYTVRSGSLSSGKLKSIKQVYTIQIKQEKIFIIKAYINTLCFIFNAFKKYYL